MKNSIKNRIYSSTWLIKPEGLQDIINFVERQADFTNLKSVIENSPTLSSWEEMNTSGEGRYYSIHGNTAVMKLHGSIVRYANLFTEWCGGTSLENFMKEFDLLMEDDRITKIVIDIDSPGGEANGLSDAAKRIYESRKKKEIVGFVSGGGYSAAYWIGSACSKLYMSDLAGVGSIGIVVEFIDDTKQMKEEGLEKITIVSDQSPEKRIDLTTEEGSKTLRETVLNPMADVFIDAVARYRGTDKETVAKKFGYGGARIGKIAVGLGMTDGVKTINELLGEEKMTEEEKKDIIAAENARMDKIKSICDDPELLGEARANHSWTTKEVAEQMMLRGIMSPEMKKKSEAILEARKVIEEDKENLDMTKQSSEDEVKGDSPEVKEALKAAMEFKGA